MSLTQIIAYDVVMIFLSASLVILCVILYFCCKKKPVESEETLPIKICPRAFAFTDVDAATDGFSSQRIIGKGRLGIVYAALLPTAELVAVKRIHPHFVLSNLGFGFSTVLKNLSRAQHPNVVPILGFSQAPGERIIVMEFIGMLSLDFYLHQDQDGASLLDWSRRFRIAAGAARGLEYLHEVMVPSVVHGCVKASNILIDLNFCARVSDYGLFLLAPQEKRDLVGYVDDENWIESGGRGVCKENDVYGFGVVLLEILSGRSCQDGLLEKWAMPLIKEKRFGELLDPRLVLPSNMEPLVRLANVALACVGNSRKCRPSFVEVAAILNTLEINVCL